MTVEEKAQVRPIAATLVVVLALVWGIVLAVSGVLELRDARNDGASLWPGVFDAGFAVLAFVIAYGAFRVRRWGWILFMTWATWTLAINLLREFYFGDPRYVPLVVGTLTVLLLTPLDVQVAFGVRRQKLRLGDAAGNSVERV